MTTLILPTAVVFDWDNTLIDTLPLITDANNHLRRSFGLPEWSMHEAYLNTQRVGREGLQHHYGERWEEAEKLFYDYIHANHLDDMQTLHGAVDLVEWLHDAGVPMGIVSNKRGPIIRAEVAALGWDRYFPVILGPDDVGNIGKPRPEGVWTALDHLLGGNAVVHNRAWYVGDTAGDVRTALAAETVPVYIDSGHAGSNGPHTAEVAALCPAHSFAGRVECLDYLKGLRDSAVK